MQSTSDQISVALKSAAGLLDSREIRESRTDMNGLVEEVKKFGRV